MNKSISAPIVVLIIVSCLVLFLLLVNWQFKLFSVQFASEPYWSVYINKTNDKYPPDQSASEPYWSVYTNKTHKYTLQYPSNWTVDASQANNEEKYQSSDCCNVATLIISNGKASWELHINPLVTGFQRPNQCDETGSDQCSNSYKKMEAMGYPVSRTITRLNSTGQIIDAYIGESDGNHGFGQIGFSNEYIHSDDMKYLINYDGTEINKYLEILDSITGSLRQTN
jgi:hypothetical protein